MPISKTDQVFNLVKSLTKSEKRSFKLYLKRIQKEGNLKFAKLFKLMDKMEVLNETVLQSRLGAISIHQFSNLKRNLYAHLLTCLRLLDTPKKIDIQIRELLDFAELLYDRGLYLQALKILNKAKDKAQNRYHDILHLEILEFEKRIESRHITRTGPDCNERLASEANLRGNVVARTSKFSGLKQRLHAWFIRNGHATTPTSQQALRALFEDYKPGFDFTDLTFFEKVYLYFSYVWYHHILLDFENVIVYAKHWIQLFQQQPAMIEKDPMLFMRGLHYLLMASWQCKHYLNFTEAKALLDQTIANHSNHWNTSAKVIGFTYQSYAQLNLAFWKGNIQACVLQVPQLIQQYEAYIRYLDAHKIMIFRYKLAWLFFCNGDMSTALDHINFITQYKKGHLREDLQIFTYLLDLLAHYELQNYDLLDYRISTTQRFLRKAKQTDELHLFTLNLMKKLLPLRDQVPAQLFEDARADLAHLQQQSHLRRSFAYMNPGVWLYSKITDSSIENLLQARFDNANMVLSQAEQELV